MERIGDRQRAKTQTLVPEKKIIPDMKVINLKPTRERILNTMKTETAKHRAPCRICTMS